MELYGGCEGDEAECAAMRVFANVVLRLKVTPQVRVIPEVLHACVREREGGEDTGAL